MSMETPPPEPQNSKQEAAHQTHSVKGKHEHYMLLHTYDQLTQTPVPHIFFYSHECKETTDGSVKYYTFKAMF